MEAITERVLCQKIQRLERDLEQLHAQLEEARQQSFGGMIGTLRLHQTVLVYVGTDLGQLQAQLPQEFGPEAARRIGNHLFNLNAAPVSQDCLHAMHKAFNRGMNRW